MVQSRWLRSVLALMSGAASLGILGLAWTLVQQAPTGADREGLFLWVWTLLFVAAVPAALLMLPVGFCSATLWRLYQRKGRARFDEDDP